MQEQKMRRFDKMQAKIDEIQDEHTDLESELDNAVRESAEQLSKATLKLLRVLPDSFSLRKLSVRGAGGDELSGFIQALKDTAGDNGGYLVTVDARQSWSAYGLVLSELETSELVSLYKAATPNQPIVIVQPHSSREFKDFDKALLDTCHDLLKPVFDHALFVGERTHSGGVFESPWEEAMGPELEED